MIKEAPQWMKSLLFTPDFLANIVIMINVAGEKSLTVQT